MNNNTTNLSDMEELFNHFEKLFDKITESFLNKSSEIKNPYDKNYNSDEKNEDNDEFVIKIFPINNNQKNKTVKRDNRYYLKKLIKGEDFVDIESGAIVKFIPWKLFPHNFNKIILGMYAPFYHIIFMPNELKKYKLRILKTFYHEQGHALGLDENEAHKYSEYKMFNK